MLDHALRSEGLNFVYLFSYFKRSEHWNIFHNVIYWSWLDRLECRFYAAPKVGFWFLVLNRADRRRSGGRSDCWVANSNSTTERSSIVGWEALLLAELKRIEKVRVSDLHVSWSPDPNNPNTWTAGCSGTVTWFQSIASTEIPWLDTWRTVMN